MESKEILEEMEMNYDEFVPYLLKKYGPAKYDYFTNATCKTKSKRISRTKEGLFCHHIDEDKGYMLSHTGCALEQPFEYQKAERLVYCNYIEHLLLHILIGKNAFWSKHQKLIAPKQFSYFIVPGVSYICSEINLLYDQNGSSVEWRNRCFKEIENNFEDYIYILNSFIQYIVDNYSGNINQKEIMVGQHLIHKELGEGIITDIDGEEIFSKVTIQFANCKKVIYRDWIDKGDYHKEIRNIKENLASDTYSNVIIKSVYNRLVVE